MTWIVFGISKKFWIKLTGVDPMEEIDGKEIRTFRVEVRYLLSQKKGDSALEEVPTPVLELTETSGSRRKFI